MTTKSEVLDRNQRQLQIFHSVFRGYGISDVTLVITGFAFSLSELANAELRRGLTLTSKREVISRVLMLVFMFLFEGAYQIHLGLAYGVHANPSHALRWVSHKSLVAVAMVAWALIGTYWAGGIRAAMAVFVVANVFAAFWSRRRRVTDSNQS